VHKLPASNGVELVIDNAYYLLVSVSSTGACSAGTVVAIPSSWIQTANKQKWMHILF